MCIKKISELGQEVRKAPSLYTLRVPRNVAHSASPRFGSEDWGDAFRKWAIKCSIVCDDQRCASCRSLDFIQVDMVAGNNFICDSRYRDYLFWYRFFRFIELMDWFASRKYPTVRAILERNNCKLYYLAIGKVEPCAFDIEKTPVRVGEPSSGLR